MPGSIIALFPSEEDAQALALSGGLPAEDLHITLLYLGKELSDDQVDLIRAFLPAFAERLDPLEAKVTAVSRFTETDGETANVLLLDGPDFPSFREGLVGGLWILGIETPSEHGFIPHMTLSYSEDERLVEDHNGRELVFPAISFVRGDEIEHFGFVTGDRTMTTKARVDAPNYHESDGFIKCVDCIFNDPEGTCNRFSFEWDAGFTCDDWQPGEGIRTEGKRSPGDDYQPLTDSSSLAKGVVPFQDLPLADRERAWDGDAAKIRLRTWAGGPDLEDVDFEKYRRGFLWYDAAEPSILGSYKLPIADVIDGEIRAVPAGLFAAAAVLQGARGGANIPDAAQETVKNQVSRYYDKMREAFDDEDLIAPWDRESVKGAKLSRAINAEIDKLINDKRSRADVLADMGDASGISASTVGQILREEIECPPLERLRGFAKILGTTLERLRGAAEDDGCEYDEQKGNALKAVKQTEDELIVENYIVLFGGRDLSGLVRYTHENKDGSVGEFFTRNTELESSYTKSVGRLPIVWEHGEYVNEGEPGRHDVLGYVDWKTAKIDDTGVFVQRVLDRRNRYIQMLEELIRQGLISTSSEAIPGEVQKASNGELLRWLLSGDALTVAPMEPRNLSSNTLATIKALVEVGVLKAAKETMPGGGPPGEDGLTARLRLKQKLLNLQMEIQSWNKSKNC